MNKSGFFLSFKFSTHFSAVVSFLFLLGFTDKPTYEYIQRGYQGNLGVKVKFYGTDFYKITKDSNQIIFDPFVSSQTPSQMVLVKKMVYDSLLYRKYNAEFKEVKHCLVTHTHFDHCYDLPYVYAQNKEMNVYGSESLVKLFGQTIGGKMTKLTLDSLYETNEMSFKAFPELHPPHFLSHEFYNGKVRQTYATPPRKVTHWKSGQAMSYYVKYPGDGLKLFMRDYTNQIEAIVVPEEVKQNGVDVLFTGFGQKKYAARNIVALIKQTKPKVVFIGHWNCFISCSDQSNYIHSSDEEYKINYIKEELKNEEITIILSQIGKEYTI